MQPMPRPGTISLPTAPISPSLTAAPSSLKAVFRELGAVIRSAETGLLLIKDGPCQTEGQTKNPPDVCTPGGAVV